MPFGVQIVTLPGSNNLHNRRFMSQVRRKTSACFHKLEPVPSRKITICPFVVILQLNENVTPSFCTCFFTCCGFRKNIIF